MSKSKLQEYVDKYKKKLGLSKYSIDYVVTDDKHYVSEEDEKTKIKVVDYHAEVVKTDHDCFSIIFNKSAFHNDLKDTVVHELLHILLWDFYEVAELIIRTSNDFCDAGKTNMLKKLRDAEHEVIEKIVCKLK